MVKRTLNMLLALTLTLTLKRAKYAVIKDATHTRNSLCCQRHKPKRINAVIKDIISYIQETLW